MLNMQCSLINFCFTCSVQISCASSDEVVGVDGGRVMNWTVNVQLGLGKKSTVVKVRKRLLVKSLNFNKHIVCVKLNIFLL